MASLYDRMRNLDQRFYVLQRTLEHVEQNLNATFENITLLTQQTFWRDDNLNVFFLLIASLIIFCVAGISYWAVGYAFAFGEPSTPFVGYNYFCGINLPSKEYHIWFFHFVFAATASTIVSGALAERCEFVAFFTYSIVITGVIYPLITHWTWASNGWLKNLGGDNFGYKINFAGSGVVHVCGGTCALVGAYLLGPRIGRFSSSSSNYIQVTNGNHTEMDIRGHSVPLTALGGFILMFGFFAFNGGSQASITKFGDGEAISRAMLITILSGASSALLVMLSKAALQHTWSLLATINGALCGMVAACAGCNAMDLWAGVVCGAIAGCAYLLWSWLLPKLHIDDPLDAVAGIWLRSLGQHWCLLGGNGVTVHLGGGLWGVLARPAFDLNEGIIYFANHRSMLNFAWNAVGTAVIVTWSALCSFVLFGAMKLLRVYRVSELVEIKGLDIVKHGEPAYPTIAYGHGWGNSWEKSFDWAKMASDCSHDQLQNNQHPGWLNGAIVEVPTTEVSNRECNGRYLLLDAPYNEHAETMWLAANKLNSRNRPTREMHNVLYRHYI